ncbi:MAG TPA: trehalose-phosphatase [Gemmatimonadaceae bacterium]|nr:trehalose-phosphatase [Gemmatimonadaceae bacterium]
MPRFVTTPLLPLSRDTKARLMGTPLVVMLDVDGTLAPIVARFDEAVVPPATQRAVGALVDRPDVHVALVSGRSAAVARRMVGVSHVWVAGNHGFEVEGPSGEDFSDPGMARYRGVIAAAVEQLRPHVGDMEGVIVEDKAITLSVHWRLADPSIAPRLRLAVDRVAQALGLRVTTGKRIYEIKPAALIDKGTAVLALAERLAAGHDEASMMFAGDDVTDEDAIRALREHHPRAVTVRIHGEGSTATAAEFSLRDTESMRVFLEELAALRH